MGTVSWRRERTGPAGSVALRSPADRVAWRSLKGMKLCKNKNFLACRIISYAHCLSG